MAMAGRGLVHSVRLAAQRQDGEVGLQGLATPATLAQTTTTELFVDALDAAGQLSRPTVNAAETIFLW
jgi:hypothetical protein